MPFQSIEDCGQATDAVCGVHLVPKLTAQFSGAYVDVRQFGLTQWNDHRPLAAALVQAGKGHILQDSAGQSLHDSMHGVLDALSGEAAAQADQVFGRY